ncbi:MAG: hypothetical protein ACJ8EQ_08835 [Sphingomicrobium sp.]|jgi:hypothetical protein
MAKIPNQWDSAPVIHAASIALLLKTNDFLSLARPLHRTLHEPNGGFEEFKRGFQMFNMFASARENATIFAGAFISALLLVSAATSLPIA